MLVNMNFWKDIWPEKDFLEKAATMERFEYLLLGKELKAQTDIEKKPYQKIGDIYEFDQYMALSDNKKECWVNFSISTIKSLKWFTTV